MKVYTVCHEESYDAALEAFKRDPHREVMKLGCREGYQGGVVLKSLEDAYQLICRANRHGEWAVYEIAAVWDADTTGAVGVPWHRLIRDVPVLRKAVSASEVPK